MFVTDELSVTSWSQQMMVELNYASCSVTLWELKHWCETHSSHTCKVPLYTHLLCRQPFKRTVRTRPGKGASVKGEVHLVLV